MLKLADISVGGMRAMTLHDEDLTCMSFEWICLVCASFDTAQRWELYRESLLNVWHVVSLWKIPSKTFIDTP